MRHWQHDPRCGAARVQLDFHRLASAAHAAFEQIAYAEFAADLFRVDGFALVSERRIPSDTKLSGTR
jgi:hypothetical protein